MKKLYFLLLVVFCVFNSKAQEVEQSIDANSFYVEGGTMIIEFVVPKSDIPVTPQYYVKDVMIDPYGDAIRANSVSGEMQYLQAGKHVIYWNIQNDAPNLGNVRGVYLVLRLTDETLQQVEEYKQKQKEEENKRILEQIRAQERQRIADSLAKIPVKKEEVVVEKTKSHTQFGITFGVGTSDALIENEDGSKPYEALMFNKEAVSWHAGIVLRTHLWSWLGLQGGVLYKEFKQAQKVVINSEVNEVYLKANYIQFPITLHLYLGRTFNIFGGYYFNQYQKAYTYEAGGKNETQWLAGVTGSEETILAEKGNGICAGLEFKGKHSALTFTYEMDKTNFTKEGIVYIPAKWTNTLLSANFSIFF